MVSARHEPFYLLFEETPVKWSWKESELALFRQMWKDGEDVQTIAYALKTNKRSIALVVMDQAEQGYIRQRERGLEGGAEIEKRR